jgi:HD-GYP domain-containing protein (c-di-GMP phosphodiesterase class II)
MSSAQTARFILAFLLVAGAWLLLGDGLALRLDPDTHMANLVPGRILILMAVTGLALYACPGRCRRTAPVEQPRSVPVTTVGPTTARPPASSEPVAPSGDSDHVWSLLGRCRQSTSGRRSLIDHSVHGTADAICHMLALRDPYTADHLERVGELSAEIAARAGESRR